MLLVVVLCTIPAFLVFFFRNCPARLDQPMIGTIGQVLARTCLAIGFQFSKFDLYLKKFKFLRCFISKSILLPMAFEVGRHNVCRLLIWQKLYRFPVGFGWLIYIQLKIRQRAKGRVGFLQSFGRCHSQSLNTKIKFLHFPILGNMDQSSDIKNTRRPTKSFVIRQIWAFDTIEFKLHLKIKQSDYKF